MAVIGRPPRPLAVRFNEQVDRNGPNGCWVWTGSTDGGGYGMIKAPGGRILKAHRVSLALAGREQPEGLQVDHLCRNRVCVNPEHLEWVTARENVLRSDNVCARNARKTHCVNGHPFSGENLSVAPDGERKCRECKRLATLSHLSVPMLDMLWTVAQHKYGWTHVTRYGGIALRTSDALVRRGLVEYGWHGRSDHSPIVVATEAGRAEIERRWPVSPFVLGTYEHQPNDWTPREGIPSVWP